MSAASPTPVLLSYANSETARKTPRSVSISLACGSTGLGLTALFLPALLPSIFSDDLAYQIRQTGLLSNALVVQLMLGCATIIFAIAGRHYSGDRLSSRYLVGLTMGLLLIPLVAFEDANVRTSPSKVLIRWTSLNTSL